MKLYCELPRSRSCYLALPLWSACHWFARPCTSWRSASPVAPYHPALPLHPYAQLRRRGAAAAAHQQAQLWHLGSAGRQRRRHGRRPAGHRHARGARGDGRRPAAPRGAGLRADQARQAVRCCWQPRPGLGARGALAARLPGTGAREPAPAAPALLAPCSWAADLGAGPSHRLLCLACSVPAPAPPAVLAGSRSTTQCLWRSSSRRPRPPGAPT